MPTSLAEGLALIFFMCSLMREKRSSLSQSTFRFERRWKETKNKTRRRGRRRTHCAAEDEEQRERWGVTVRLSLSLSLFEVSLVTRPILIPWRIVHPSFSLSQYSCADGPVGITDEPRMNCHLLCLLKSLLPLFSSS